MTQHGKKYKESLSKVDREELYGVAEAVDLVKSLASAKFDETVELAVRLGVDPRKADQIVRGTISLPSGTGRTVRVAVFAAGEAAAEARAAGADVVGADDLVAKINGGFLDFDIAIATPGPDGTGGHAGPGPRPTRPDAQPQDGHRYHRRGQGGGRVQGRPGRVPHRQGGQHPHPRRQGLVHPRPAGGQHPGRRRGAPAGQAGRPPRAATSCRSPCRRRWAPASTSTRSRPASATRRSWPSRPEPGPGDVHSRPGQQFAAPHSPRRAGTESERQRPPVHPQGAEAARRAGPTRRTRCRCPGSPVSAPSTPEILATSGRSNPVEDTMATQNAQWLTRSRWSPRSRRASRRRRPPS